LAAFIAGKEPERMLPGEGEMKGHCGAHLLLLLAAAACMSTGCHGGRNQFSGAIQNSVPVNLVMHGAPDAPPAGISFLSFHAMLTGATLSPGNFSLLDAGQVEIEFKRLELETSLVGMGNVPPGTYTSVDLIFANPSLTFRNDTGSTITVGGTACASGQICVASPTVVSFSGPVDLPGSGVTLSAKTPAALQVDLNLSTLLANNFQVDLNGAASVSALAPPQGEPFSKLEDVVGTVSAKSTANSGFTLHTGLGDYAVTVNSSTAFLNFPASVCSAAGFACVANSQIVSVDMALPQDGTLLADRIIFEDADSSKPEIEGVVVATTGQTPPAQFQIVVLQETPSVPGLDIGSVVTVSGQTASFDADQLGWDTTAYSFQGVQDLLVGQEVQVRRLSTSTSTNLDVDRIRLRSSRFSATVQIVSLPDFTLSISSLPKYMQTAGIVTLRVHTDSSLTEFEGNATNDTQIFTGNSVSLRGQLFENGTGTAVLLATKVVKN
jgi:hypothetical protein